MGYTAHQIDLEFNKLINSYISEGYKEVPCSNICYYGNTLRMIDLGNSINGDRVTCRLSLVTNFANSYPYLDLVETKFVNGSQVSKTLISRFYCIGNKTNKYYSNSFDEAKKCRAIGDKRFISRLVKSNCCYLNIEKLSDRAKHFITSNVNKRLLNSGRSLEWALYDVYFSYLNNNRNLNVVIKHSDSNRTESITI